MAPPGGACLVVLTQHSWGQTPLALHPPQGSLGNLFPSGIMRVHASEAGATPSCLPHRKLPEDNKMRRCHGNPDLPNQKPRVGLHLHSPCNQGLMQAWWSTHCLNAVNAHPPPRHADPKPESSDRGGICATAAGAWELALREISLHL